MFMKSTPPSLGKGSRNQVLLQQS